MVGMMVVMGVTLPSVDHDHDHDHVGGGVVVSGEGVGELVAGEEPAAVFGRVEGP
jgi:hypothetical protein